MRTRQEAQPLQQELADVYKIARFMLFVGWGKIDSMTALCHFFLNYSLNIPLELSFAACICCILRVTDFPNLIFFFLVISKAL